MPRKAITVLLVDDHSLVRRGFRRMLEDDEEVAVVGEACDGTEAVRLAAGLKPDVIVMDFALPGMNGAAATREILKSNPRAAVLILSMHSEANYIRTCLEAGARGYLLKNAMDLELADAVREIAKGRRVLDPHLAAAAAEEPEGRQLTAREREVLRFIVEGKSNKEIAGVLGLSPNTVNVHRANIMQALDIHNTADLVVHAIRTGLVNIP